MKQVRTVYPIQPFKTFDGWKQFLKSELAVHEGGLSNPDIKKEFTINENHLKKVNEIKWIEGNYPPYLWDKGRYEKYKKELIETKENVDDFYAKKKREAMKN